VVLAGGTIANVLLISTLTLTQVLWCSFNMPWSV